MASHPAEEYRRGMLEMAASVPRLIAHFSRLDIPVLGVCGADDPFPDEPQQLAAMKTFREAAPIPGGGRFVHWQQPQAFNRLLRDFIEEA
jgi:pimeloyl-ACP methyl ester carboxylesterase